MYPRKIILHHSLTEDGPTASWGAIRKYHMSYTCEGQIISKDERLKILDRNESLPAAQRKKIKSPWSDIGYHAGIELVRDFHEIFMGRMWNKPGAHCVEARMNYKSLGICFIGNFDLAPPPPEMWALGLKYVKFLQQLYNIPTLDVDGHHSFASYKSCPGQMFDIQKFRADLGQLR